MTQCPKCHISVKGDWSVCPLCRSALEKEAGKEIGPSSFINAPLRFNRVKVLRVFTFLSFLLIALYFVLHYIYRFEFFSLEYVLFGLITTGLTILIIIRKRRNIVKGITYVLALFSLISLYFDYINGWIGWSITFVIPILSISVLLAMVITVRFVRLKVEDYVLYLQLAAIVGIVPLLFLVMNWTGHPLPSIISVLFSSIVFLVVLVKYRKKIRSELEKRMHV